MAEVVNSIVPATQIIPYFEDMLGYQHGGLALEPQLAMIGEVDEAVIPLDRLPDMMQGRSSDGGITVYGDLYGWEDFMDKIGEANRDIRRSGGTDVI